MTIGLRKPCRGSHHLVATFSIVGCDSQTGELGVAVQSKFLAAGAVVGPEGQRRKRKSGWPLMRSGILP